MTNNLHQLVVAGGNTARLLNAEETEGYGLEVNSEFMLSDNWSITASASYNKTEIKDDDLAVPTCVRCTVTDPTFNVDGTTLLL